MPVAPWSAACSNKLVDRFALGSIWVTLVVVGVVELAPAVAFAPTVELPRSSVVTLLSAELPSVELVTARSRTTDWTALSHEMKAIQGMSVELWFPFRTAVVSL